MSTSDNPTTDAVKPAATGHPIGFWFFFWGEFAERCSYYGMRAILALYMTERLGVDEGDAGTYMSLFIAACYFFPLIGGWLADNYFGKYWTIVGFSIPYVFAQFIVGIENQYVVIGALLLLAMGSGVIKPNISTLMGMTYDQQRPGQDQLRTSAFSWFYMAINIGAALSQFSMPWLRTNYDYQTAFLFPACSMAIALVIFALGKRFYAVEKIERKVLSPEEAAIQRKLKKDTLLRIGSVFLTVMFFWAIFDQAASTWIFFANTYMDCHMFGYYMSPDSIQGFNPLFIVILVPVSVWKFKKLENMGWKILATQKLILGFILTAAAMAIMSLSGFLAGESEKVIKVTLPEGTLILPYADIKLEEIKASEGGQLLPLGTYTSLSASDWQYNEDKKKLYLTKGQFAFANNQIVSIQDSHLVIQNALDFPVNDQVLEINLKSGDELTKAKDAKDPEATVEFTEWVKPVNRVTVWWQVFAYLVLTVAEILISITGLELAFVAAPQSMKSFVTACWLAIVFLANLLINAPITQLYPLIAPGIYFAGLGVAMLIITVIFLPIARKFNLAMQKPLE